jgi:hypothetical protein
VTCDAPVSGSLTAGDCTLDDDSFIDLYSFTVAEGTVLDINIASETLDTVLVVLDSLCQVIATNDDCTPEQVVSCIERLVIAPGDYFISVAGFGAGETGDYVLSVDCEVFDPCTHCIAGSVICGDTVTGEISTDDCPRGNGTFMELWELTIDEPTAVTVELASVEFEPLVFILDGGCGQLAVGDDCAAGNPDGACASAWVQPGTYFIAVTTVDDQGSGAYDLLINCAPADQVCVDCEVALIECGEDIEGVHPTAVDCVSPRGASLDIFSFVLAEDETVTISILGDYDTYLHLLDSDCIPIDEDDDGGPGLNSVIARDLTAGTYFIGVSSFLPGAGGGFTLTVDCGVVPLCDDCVVGDIECDGNISDAFPQTECVSARFTPIDLYRFEISETFAVTIDLIGNADPDATFDTYLHLFDADCVQIAFNDDGGEGFNSRLGADLRAGTYYIGVSSYATGETGAFDLSVTCAEVVDLCSECRVSTIACGGTVEGEHPQTECVSRRNQPMDIYTFEIRTAGEVTINLSATWDTYLHLFDSECVEIAFNDDIGGGDFNSSIFAKLEPGMYSIGVSRFNASDGPMSLELLCDGANDCVECAVGEIGPGEERSVDLGGSGCTDTDGGGLDVWTFDVPGGFSGTINLAADAFDPTLTLLDSDCQQIDFNDDANAGTLHSQLSVDLPPGVYSIRVNTVFADESGPYVLTVSGVGVGPFLRGDWDANGMVQLTDGVNVFNFLFLGGGAPICMAAADANGQGIINLSSGVYVLNFLFTGGSSPLSPFPDCGPGGLPSDETLGCEEAHACL